MPTGYSGRPLAAKLGLKPGQKAYAVGMPESVATEIDAEVPGFSFAAEPSAGLDVAPVFTAPRAELEREIARLRPSLAPAGMIWVSWPKKASKVPTDITEDTIREAAFPHGPVDGRACAAAATWSGVQ